MLRASILVAFLTAAVAAVMLAPVVSAQAPPQSSGPAPLATGEAAVRPWKRYSGWPTRDTARFDTLADQRLSPPAPSAPRKLDGPITGDPAIGAKLMADRTRGGSCLACHVMGQAGNAGLKDEELFNFVYDARVYHAETIMPPWGTNGLFSDAEIGHIVAFLKTLTKPAVFPTEVDDPNKRPPPVETRTAPPTGG